MARVESPPAGREAPVVRALLLPVVVMAGATTAAAALVAEPARIPVVWCGAVATVVVVALAAEIARRGRTIRRRSAEYQQRVSTLERRIAEHDEETVRIGKELLPSAIHRLRVGNSPDEVLRDVVDSDPVYRHLPDSQRSLVYTVLDIIDNEEATRDSAQRAFVN